VASGIGIIRGLCALVVSQACVLVDNETAGVTANGPSSNFQVVCSSNTARGDCRVRVSDPVTRLVVKLKTQGTEVFTGHLAELDHGKVQGSSTNLVASLAAVHAKYGIKTIRRVFFNGADKARLGQVKDKLEKVPHTTTNKKHTLDDFLQTYVVEIGAGKSIVDAVREYRGHPMVDYVHPDHRVWTTFTPNDPSFSQQWDMVKINMEQAWDVTRGDGIVVAVVDTGIDYNHNDLAANIWSNNAEIVDDGIDNDGNGYVDDVRGWDCFNSDNNPMDDDSAAPNHGTHVAGTIAAIDNNNTGISGVAPNAKIMAVKAIDASGSGTESSCAEGLLYAALNGAHVINNSWGGGFDDVITSAIQTAYGLGSTIVFAAGNDNKPLNSVSDYASMSETISVGSTDSSDGKAPTSNYGTTLDVAAPGENIYSTMATDAYQYLSGTSMAAPHVSGVAALILAYRPSFSNEDVRQVLRTSAVDLGAVGFDSVFGHGRIDAYQALQISSPCRAKISSPIANDVVDGASLSIHGSAYGSTCGNYLLEFAVDESGPWQQINSGSPLVNGVLGEWDVSGLSGRFFVRVGISNTTGDHFLDFVGPVWINVPGLLVNMGEDVHWTYAPVVADLDGDGTQELVLTTSISGGGALNIIHADGTYLLKQQLTDYGLGAPAIADIDSDGQGEILVSEYSEASGGLADIPQYQVFAIELDGSSVPGWPVKVQGVLNGQLAVGDMDSSGDLEVIVCTANAYWLNNETEVHFHELHAFHADGSLVTGWPLDYGEQWSAMSNPVLVDLDNNGTLEILLGVRDWVDINAPGAVLAYRHDGTPVPGFPFETNYWNWNVTAGDIDRDGTIDILAHGERRDAHGEGVAPWSGYDAFDTALGDLDNNGDLEVVHSMGNGVLVLDKSGEVTSTLWPKILPGGDWPGRNAVITDLDNDGDREIVLATYEGLILAWHHDGTEVNGFPKQTAGVHLRDAVVGDFDGDGFVDVIGTGYDAVYFWNDFNTRWISGCCDWAFYQRDRLRGGAYTFCDDNDPCTERDTCTLGECDGTPMDCSHLDDECNNGYCEAGVCQSQFFNEGRSCDDGDPQTSASACVQGVCRGVDDGDDQNPPGDDQNPHGDDQDSMIGGCACSLWTRSGQTKTGLAWVLLAGWIMVRSIGQRRRF